MGDTAKADAPPAVEASPPTDERLLEVMAELTLVRRQASLIDARLRRFEERLDDACRVVDELLADRSDEVDPVERLAELERRVARLGRRRAPVVEAAPTSPPPPEPTAPLVGPIDLPETVAIVRARWLVDDTAAIGPLAEVELCADVDGIAPGEPVQIEVRPLGAATAVAVLHATCDGDQVRARWRIPGESDERAWCFAVRHGAAESISPPLYVA